MTHADLIVDDTRRSDVELDLLAAKARSGTIASVVTGGLVSILFSH